MLRSARLAVLAVLLAALLPACIVMDVRADHENGFKSFGFISGYATAGWPADDSLLKIGLFEGRSDGTLLYVAVWKLVRVEIGLIGLAVGVGPLDAGLGLFFYDPVPPRYERDEGEKCAPCGHHCDCDEEDCCEEGGCEDCDQPPPSEKPVPPEAPEKPVPPEAPAPPKP